MMRSGVTVQKSTLRVVARAAISSALAGVTVWLLALGERTLPYGSALSNAAGACLVPAFVIAAIFFPEGAHTGRGVPYFGYVLWAAGILFYTALWFAILSTWRRLRGRRRSSVDIKTQNM